MVKKSNSRFGKSSFRKFMKSSQISPDFINNDLDLDYAPNYGKSLASHASHVVNTTPDVNESNESSSGDESYRSNTTLESDNDADTNDADTNDTDTNVTHNHKDNNDTQVDDTSYSSITKNKDLKIFKMKNLLAQKRKTLFYKEQEIKELGKQNSFLETVIRDYENYNNTILEEKQKQKKALKILSKHIREISKNINNDDSYLNRVKNDQTLLLDEIEKMRDEIAHVLNSRGVEYQSSDADMYDEEYHDEDDDEEYHDEDDDEEYHDDDDDDEDYDDDDDDDDDDTDDEEYHDKN